MFRKAILVGVVLFFRGALFGQVPDTVFLEELTWTEVRDAIQAGKTTVIVPTGGTEQTGPHIVLGKHNFIVKHTAEKIARRLGDALVAPVVAYVPEGELDPPTSHMRFSGTITLPNEYFMKLVEYAARSFRVHGFKDIVLIADSRSNNQGLKTVSEMLNKEWANSDIRVHFVSDYNMGNGCFDLQLKSFHSITDACACRITHNSTRQKICTLCPLIHTDQIRVNSHYL